MIGAERQRRIGIPRDVRALAKRDISVATNVGVRRYSYIVVGKRVADRCGRRVVDQNVLWIEQQRSRYAARRASINIAGEGELAVARRLHETAVAALRAAAGEDRSGKGGLAVGPQHDLAAVAAPGGRRVDRRVRVDAHGGRGRDGEVFELGALIGDEAQVRMAAAPVAADQDLAAAAAAGRVDLGVGDLDVLAAHHDRAAGRAAVLARGRDRAGELDGLRRSARRLAAAGGGVEHDHAVVAADRVGPDHALGVDDGIDHRARRRGGELDPPAVGAERAALGVADQRLERPAGGDVDDL